MTDMAHSFEPNKRASDAWGHPIYIWADDGWRWGPVPYQRNGPGWHGSVDDAEDAAVEAAARNATAPGDVGSCVPTDPDYDHVTVTCSVCSAEFIVIAKFANNPHNTVRFCSRACLIRAEFG